MTDNWILWLKYFFLIDYTFQNNPHLWIDDMWNLNQGETDDFYLVF